MKIRKGDEETPTSHWMDTARILVVTDDRAIREATETALSKGGYEVSVAGPETANRRRAETKPDLVLLDMRAVGAGWKLIHEITENHTVPLVLIAQRGSRDVVQAFRAGAADCITDPFEESETLARVQNALQNRHRSCEGEHWGTIRIGELTIDLRGRTVTLAGLGVSLTQNEFQTLSRLASNPGIAVPHTSLGERDWGESEDEGALVRTCVMNLRRKLGDDARNPTYIGTVPGFGYRLNRTAPRSGEDEDDRRRQTGEEAGIGVDI